MFYVFLELLLFRCEIDFGEKNCFETYSQHMNFDELVPLLKFYFHEEFQMVVVSGISKLLRAIKLAMAEGQAQGCKQLSISD